MKLERRNKANEITRDTGNVKFFLNSRLLHREGKCTLSHKFGRSSWEKMNNRQEELHYD